MENISQVSDNRNLDSSQGQQVSTVADDSLSSQSIEEQFPELSVALLAFVRDVQDRRGRRLRGFSRTNRRAAW